MPGWWCAGMAPPAGRRNRLPCPWRASSASWPTQARPGASRARRCPEVEASQVERAGGRGEGVRGSMIEEGGAARRTRASAMRSATLVGALTRRGVVDEERTSGRPSRSMDDREAALALELLEHGLAGPEARAHRLAVGDRLVARLQADARGEVAVLVDPSTWSPVAPAFVETNSPPSWTRFQVSSKDW